MPGLCRRTELHFVRCIKPNNDQAQDDYDAPLVLHQLRCCGITEVARIARAGYPTRYAHQQFAHRYSALLGNKLPSKMPTLLLWISLLVSLHLLSDLAVMEPKIGGRCRG